MRKLNLAACDLIELYCKQGKAKKEVAQIFSCHPGTIDTYLRKFGIRKRRFVKDYANNFDRDELHKLYWQDSKTLREIGEIIHLPKDTVRVLFQHLGLPLRSRYEANKLIAQKNSLYRRGVACGKSWKGGRIKTSTGYIYMKAEGHPYSNSHGYVLEHRLVMEQKLGRYLLPSERVHHINGIKTDNRPENLMLVSRANHSIYNQLCSHCPLRTEIRLLRWHLKELEQSLQERLNL